MSPLLTLRDGKLAETLAELQDRVRSDPSDARHRIFLFELLSVLGQWDRALTQLNVAGELSPAALAMVQTYREALRCEVLRAEVFGGQRSPLVFGRPEQWVALLIEALRLTADGRDAQAEELRHSAYEAAAATPGTLRSDAEGAAMSGAQAEEPPARRFEWIADGDSRLGPVLEAIVNGRYYWIPFCNIRTILVEKPADLRDLVWTPAQFQWANGGESVGLIPTRYPGAEASDDDAIRLARKTDWVGRTAETYTGLGQRMIATDVAEYALMDLRRIDLEGSAAEEGASPDVGEGHG
ncbi:MAG: virulence protein SciE type [Candidatus Eisenbacteria bacterium RBG_16_71_46]|nr:MAG: virulence protein SciE type [Candidatus Eisenbacteria bacterium RBG_16_71_46]